MWNSAVASRVDESLIAIYTQYGENVTIRRRIPDEKYDTLYGEDLTRTEIAVDVLGVFNNNLSRRTLSKFGRTEPVDLAVTFASVLLRRAGIATGLLEMDWIIETGGLRYTIVEEPMNNQYECSVVAVISAMPNAQTTAYDAAQFAPLVVEHIRGTADRRTILLTLNQTSTLVGEPRYRFRVTVDGTPVPITDVAAMGGGIVSLQLGGAVTAWTDVRVAYTQGDVLPVHDGVVSVRDAASELSAFGPVGITPIL